MNENRVTFYQTRNTTYVERSQGLVIKQKALEAAQRELRVSNKVDEFH